MSRSTSTSCGSGRRARDPAQGDPHGRLDSCGSETLEPLPNHRSRLNDRQGIPPRLPTADQDHPQSSVPVPEAKTPITESTREDSDLMTEREVLQRELTPRSKRRPGSPEGDPNQVPHDADATHARRCGSADFVRMSFRQAQVAMLSRSPIERPCVAALYAPTQHIVVRSSAPVLTPAKERRIPTSSLTEEASMAERGLHP